MRGFGLTIFLLFASVLLLTGCGEREEPVKSKLSVTSEIIKEGTKEALEKAFAFAQQRREEYQKQIEAKLNEFSTRLTDLKTTAEAPKKEAPAGLNLNIEELSRKKEIVNRKLEELQQSASAETWKDKKSELDAAIGALEKAYNEAVSKIR